MEDTIADRVQKLINARGISVREAERMSGLGDGTISKFLNNRDQSPHARTVSAIAKGFGVAEHWLWTGTDGPPVDARNYGPGSTPLPPLPHEMSNDIPVLGTAAGSHVKGAFQLSNDAIDYVRRPPGLVGAKGIYGLYVEGESMVPQFFPADLIFVNPHKPVRLNDAVVVQTSYVDGEVEGTIGIYLRRDEEWITIGKHNPKAEVKIKRGNHTQVHKILSNNELFGI